MVPSSTGFMLDKHGPLTSCAALPNNLLSSPHATCFSFCLNPFYFFYRGLENTDNISSVVREQKRGNQPKICTPMKGFQNVSSPALFSQLNRERENAPHFVSNSSRPQVKLNTGTYMGQTKTPQPNYLKHAMKIWETENLGFATRPPCSWICAVVSIQLSMPKLRQQIRKQRHMEKR